MTGAKHHILTCGNGLPIAIVQSAANVNDHLVLPELLDRVRPLRGRPGRPREKITALIADKGYDYPRVYDELEQRRITAYIPRRVNVAHPQMHFDLVVKSDLLSTSR
ncbi:transposase [Nocardia fluminea]|uniref:transposase n=1 Tax=Nocardia fluminea TaxID=134984 RepID=UPI00364A7A0D